MKNFKTKGCKLETTNIFIEFIKEKNMKKNNKKLFGIFGTAEIVEIILEVIADVLEIILDKN